MPQRIQRKRVKGWRMPEGAVYVGRPTEWGNPWRPGQVIAIQWPRGAPVQTVREFVITPRLAVLSSPHRAAVHLADVLIGGRRG